MVTKTVTQKLKKNFANNKLIIINKYIIYYIHYCNIKLKFI